MTITWSGGVSVIIEGTRGVLALNPPAKASGTKSPKTHADLIAFTHSPPPRSDWAHIIKDDTVVVTLPGEYDKAGFFLFGTSGNPAPPSGSREPEKDEPNIYRIDVERKAICYIADYPYDVLAVQDLEALADIDVLIVALGTLGIERTAKIIKDIEPKVVIPVDFTDLPVEFLKEMGVSGTEATAKFSVKEKDTFTGEGTEIVVLKP